jgi:type III secretion protein U
MADDKTEEPSAKRLKDAREDGETSKSTDLVDGIRLLAGAILLSATGASLARSARSTLHTAFRFVESSHDMKFLVAACEQIVSATLLAVVPILAVGTFVGIIALIPQVGFMISMKPVAFKFDAINPAAGIKKIFSLHSLIDLFKLIIKGILISVIMFFVIENILPMVAKSIFQNTPQLLQISGHFFLIVLYVGAASFVLTGAIDFKIQKLLFLRGKRMSKDELKKEHKESEGDPLIKSQRKKFAKELLESAPRPKIGTANMVVVNPTHYAVAVRYSPEETPIPIVVVKGMDNAALAIRHEAQLANVPIIGNPPVARALFKVRQGAPIPEDMYETVAAILRWVEALGSSPEQRSVHSNTQI